MISWTYFLLFKKPSFPDFDLFWLGSTAPEREGAFYHISLEDHPAFALNAEPKRLAASHLNLVGLSRRKVSDPLNNGQLSQAQMSGSLGGKLYLRWHMRLLGYFIWD